MQLFSLTPAEFAHKPLSNHFALVHAVVHQHDVDLLADLVALLGRALAHTASEQVEQLEALHVALVELLHRVRQGGPWSFVVP